MPSQNIYTLLAMLKVLHLSQPHLIETESFICQLQQVYEIQNQFLLTFCCYCSYGNGMIILCQETPHTPTSKKCNGFAPYSALLFTDVSTTMKPCFNSKRKIGYESLNSFLQVKLCPWRKHVWTSAVKRQLVQVCCKITWSEWILCCCNHGYLYFSSESSLND